MNKLANMRHWPERMSPANFGMTRGNNMGMPGVNPLHQQQQHPQQQKVAMQMGGPLIGPHPQVAQSPIHYSFNVPFASDLAGPDTEDILHATADAVMRWTHPGDAPDDVPVYELPVHTQNLASLRKMCRDITQTALPIEAHVLSTIPQKAKTQVTTVCLSGVPELVFETRERILNEMPILLRCTTVDVDGELFADLAAGRLKEDATSVLGKISEYCGVDIFLLGPKLTPIVDGLNGDVDVRRDQRWRLAIYGDLLSSEHAKTRVLIHIDRLLGRVVESFRIELSVHQNLSGRNRKNIKLIESQTNTAIYFPPTFSAMYGYCPPKAHRRDPQEIFITGEDIQTIDDARKKFHDYVRGLRLFHKDVQMPSAKMDSILLSRLEKVRKIMEANGTFVQFPPLGSRRPQPLPPHFRVQALENLHAERTIREIMALAGQFYTATWWISQPETRLPSPDEIRTMLGDVCANSDADVSFDNSKLTFTVTGSDEAVKDALGVISQIKFVAQSQYQIRVKIELASEHKEFVSGKKNGKINKIMGQASVQIVFDGHEEYNFNIEVVANGYEHMRQGLSLVEQEMPASISFHVPDQYHKRIIGIGGQHIQKIMKKHSVFVKFSNAMDRGGLGREDDDSRVDNVICRTPARNAANLELVKAEILEMVDRVDSEFTSQIVNVDRLYHRQLITRLAEIDNLEKKWNCKIVFPSTEQASDEVTVTGPQWQVPMCVDEFLGMVPDDHKLILERTPTLVKFLESPEFVQTIIPKLKKQYEVDVSVHENPEEVTEDGKATVTLYWTFTRNNAGGLRDAVEYLQAQSAMVGVEANIVKGHMPRPASDTFEQSLKHFNSKLLQHAPASVATDSPTKASFGEEVARERSTIFDRLRKPGSMSSISSFLDRRKNSSHSATNSFFKGSSNVSKSSLISIESTRSFNADRNPWNDSGVNLPDEDNNNNNNNNNTINNTINGSNPWSHGRAYAGNGNGHDHKLAVPHPGDVTPRHATRQSGDSGRPSTSHSTNSGYPGHAFGPNFR